MRWMLLFACAVSSSVLAAASTLLAVQVDSGQLRVPLTAKQSSVDSMLNPGVLVGFNPQPVPLLFAPVPEPASVAMLPAGLALIAGWHWAARRSRRRR